MHRTTASMRRCVSLQCLALSLGTCLINWAKPALAHAPPQVLQIEWQPDGDGLLLVTNRGLIFGDTSFEQWRIMCNVAIGLNTIERPDVAYLPGGMVLVASSRGLQATTDDGCTWEPVEPIGSLSAPAMAQHPLDSSTLLVATFGAGQSGIQKSSDGGKTFSMLLNVDENDFIEELLFAPSAPDSIYFSGQVFDTTGKVMHYLAFSHDAGLTWQRHEIPLLDHESNFTLLAADPNEPNILLAKAEQDAPTTQSERLLISSDNGQTFASPLSIMQLSSVAFSADSSTLWVAGIDGIWRSLDQGETFEQLTGKSRITSVTERDGSLWVGGYYAPDTDGLAISNDGGEIFEKVLAFPEVEEQVACAATSNTAIECEVSWQDWQREQFGVFDAGMPPSKTDAGPTVANDGGRNDATQMVASNDKTSGGCGCTVARVGNATAAAGLLALGLFAWTARRRQRAARLGRPA